MDNQKSNNYKHENKKALIENFLSLIVLRGFQFLIPLITLPYLVRTIGVENFGLVNFALSLGAYFGAIIQFGFGVTATRDIARNREDKVRLAKVYSTTLCASVLLALLSAAVFGLIIVSFPKFRGQLGLYYFCFALIVFQSLFPIWFFQGMERMKYIAFLNLGASSVYLLLLVIFVKHESEFMLVPLLHAIAAFASLLSAVWIIKKNFDISLVIPSWGEIKLAYSESYHGFVSQFCPNLYNNSAVFLLGIFAGSHSVGIYASATKVIDAVISFAYILSNTFLPYLARNLKKHKPFQVLMLSSGLVLSALTIFFAEWIVLILFGSGNKDISVYLQWLAVCILPAFSIMTYGANYLMLVGKDIVVKNVSLYTSLLFFFVALFLIPIFNIWGAIIVLIGARLMMGVLQFCFFYKYRDLGGSYD